MTWAALAGQVLSGIQSYNAQKEAVAANNKAVQATANQVVSAYNYDISALETQRQQAFTQTINSLQSAKRQGSRNLSSVQAALGESIGGEGRTGKALERSVQFDVSEATKAIRENYSDYGQSITANEERAALSANNQLSSLKSQVKSAPSMASTLLGLGASYLSYRTSDLSSRNSQEAAGVISPKSNSSYTFSTPSVFSTNNSYGWNSAFGSAGLISSTGQYNFSNATLFG